ncbi:hypothetical protein [Streptomyces sp. enrichment culture]|uniref:hypothetical protein n=1 Tax=Streptomyces sp. enrichment culture TaxID=1795815 RepID=UPI003F557FE1
MEHDLSPAALAGLRRPRPCPAAHHGRRGLEAPGVEQCLETGAEVRFVPDGLLGDADGTAGALRYWPPGPARRRTPPRPDDHARRPHLTTTLDDHA